MDRKRKRKEKSGTGGLRVLTRHSCSSLPSSRRHRVLLQRIGWTCQIVTMAGRIRTFGIWRQERTECTVLTLYFQARVGKLVFV